MPELLYFEIDPDCAIAVEVDADSTGFQRAGTGAGAALPAGTPQPLAEEAKSEFVAEWQGKLRRLLLAHPEAAAGPFPLADLYWTRPVSHIAEPKPATISCCRSTWSTTSRSDF
ncbi:hypothetical protein [Phytohabitans aurantiacus]|uniref:Uncharacterized protein n=1 Tax=Phytohabitans aurantiacus TaxID=3016789 RepID=A0ABQ5QTS4_9ACTN|nr:hypothetical protein [Phytohabitans aurantiacus]GLH97041.1 hypothetical protein Pa4123_23150 [Phytohabitans aurantiacus]